MIICLIGILNCYISNKTVLVLDPEDADALQTHLFLLLKTSKYQEALKITDRKPEMFRFERAYALYRMQREKDAEELLKDAKDEDRAAVFLRAQIVRLMHLL
jgi:signal recognition particle subunit SRP72